MKNKAQPTSSRRLIDEHPLQVLPSLAVDIGLNEAIILQQVHYWITGAKSHEREGFRWVYNSIPEWKVNFPWWSESTIKRAIGELRKMKLLVVANFNKEAFDKTLWYRIDYEALNSLEKPKRMTRRSGQDDPTIGSKRPDDQGNLTRPIPETTTETTTETTDFDDDDEYPSAPSAVSVLGNQRARSARVEIAREKIEKSATLRYCLRIAALLPEWSGAADTIADYDEEQAYAAATWLHAWKLTEYASNGYSLEGGAERAKYTHPPFAGVDNHVGKIITHAELAHDAPLHKAHKKLLDQELKQLARKQKEKS